MHITDTSQNSRRCNEGIWEAVHRLMLLKSAKPIHFRIIFDWLFDFVLIFRFELPQDWSFYDQHAIVP